MIASAPVLVQQDGSLRLDTKFVEGMALHRKLWDGPVHCVLWKDSGAIPFGASHDPKSLPFTLDLLEHGQPVAVEHLAGASVVAASADLSEALALAPLCRAIDARLVLSVEYTLQTRLKVLALDRNLGALRKARSLVWHLGTERKRRAAFRAADGVQFNGYPAEQAYRSLTRDGILYLDGRMHPAMMASDAEMADRAARLRRGEPVRIVHSGRLETMKGVQDLLPVMQALSGQTTGFQLDIFGDGSLAPELQRGIAALGLQDKVKLHGPVDFETVLVPYMRTKADLFLSCHRQADPSCTYLESQSCGLPVMGYDNAMWQALQAASGGGWVVPMGQIKAMADALAGLIRDPGAIIACADKALAFGKAHDFEAEFALRMNHYAKFARPKASGSAA